MPQMSFTPKTYNDLSNLSPGWKPAFALAQLVEPTRENSQRYVRSPLSYRWQFAVWEVDTLLRTTPPERQSISTSTIFNPAGNTGRNHVNASRAYSITKALLNREILPGEIIDLDPLFPIPCKVEVERREGWANLMNVAPWPEGQQYLTGELRQHLAQFLLTFGQATNQPLTPTSPPPPQAHPSLQSWERAERAAPAQPTKSVNW